MVELDGSQHLDQEDYDTQRSAFLEPKGYHVIRIWNEDVMSDIQAVLEAQVDGQRHDLGHALRVARKQDRRTELAQLLFHVLF